MKRYKIAFIVVLAIVFTACQTANKIKSPTETMMALHEAAKTKDAETIKKLVSKGTLDLLELSARNKNISVDELLKQENGAPFQEMPETRNEKIFGDAATVEVKYNTSGQWETIPFVKEDGIWKVALDKFMENLMMKARDAMNHPPPSVPPAGNEAKKPESNSAINK